ncbi:proline and serine-rich protein 3 isoform X1 [Girardinichthys multiradiatus]|uniref:proline and serine-rich protein 3 isoform X1 n=2 Tax=Girardinichthys multiradiatus TaxID=208333 RepID=UPI001FADABF2|nr:proline and serine-rich protein 3 isoform X1 [Girardinichthys multiradiatus]
MKSSGAVFTRQNPFPPSSTVKRAHYHPSRKQSSKKEKAVTLSPVRLHQSSKHPPRSLNRESQQLCENLDFPASDGQHVFAEFWPSTECGSSSDSNTDFHEMLPDKLSVRLETSTVPSGVKEDSVLAKYVERFRHGRPQSREERQQMASTDGRQQMPFWWKAHSSPPSLTPTKSLDKDGHDSTVYSPVGQPQHDRSFNVVSDSSVGEFDDTEILHLQERASRLLLRGECSQSDESFPVSSDGLGCYDFSSPASVDEPVRQPWIPSLIKPVAAKVSPDSAPASSSRKPVIPTVTPHTRPQEDILFQWRLRRKMEQARGWSQSMSQSGLHDSAFSWQAPGLLHASTSGQPYKQQQSSQPPQFSERDAHSYMTAPHPEITETHRLSAPAPSPPLFHAAVVSSSSLMSQTQALTHVPAHMHLLCDVLPCPNQSSVANNEQSISQKLSEPQTKVVHKKTQVSESILSPNSDGLIKECLPSSRHASAENIKEEGPMGRKGLDKNKKKKLATQRSHQKTALPSSQQRKPTRDCSNPSLPQKTTSLKEQHEQDGSEEESCIRGHLPPSSPVHTALGQVVSEVLFPTVAQRTPASSVSPPTITSSPSHSPVPLNVTQNSLEVISQLLQEAEDSDGKEFEDDPLLQVLRQQRKWVKDQIREVDVMLKETLKEQPAA